MASMARISIFGAASHRKCFRSDRVEARSFGSPRQVDCGVLMTLGRGATTSFPLHTWDQVRRGSRKIVCKSGVVVGMVVHGGTGWGFPGVCEGSPPSPLPTPPLSLPGRLSRVAGKRIHTTCTSHPDFSDSPSQFEFVALSRCLNAWSSCGSSSLCVTRQHAQERAREHSRALTAVKWLHLDASDENVFESHCTKPDTQEASIVLENHRSIDGCNQRGQRGTDRSMTRYQKSVRHLHP